MTPAGIVRAVVFYLFLFYVVFFLDGGLFLSYTLIVIASLLFMALAKVGPRAGNPLPGLAIGVAAISMTLCLMLATGSVAVDGLDSSAGGALAVGLAVQILVAVAEEMSFRGYLLPDLRNQFGLPAAIFLSSVGFSLLHLKSLLSLGVESPQALLALANIAVAGAVLALLMLRYGLVAAMGFHFAWNFLQYSVYGMGLTGEYSSLVQLTQTGSALMTGGDFGPEASLPGTMVLFATLGVLWYLYRRQDSRRSSSSPGPTQ